MEEFVTALVTAFTSVATDTLGAISKIAPVALPVLGAIIVLSVAIKVFKRVTGR
jgi:hypothetical protein|nr:MAG TPA: major coat protein [Inoviridae sp.]